MERLSKTEEAAIWHQAIDLAKGAGECRYLNDASEPQCVVAQAWVLFGGDPAAMKSWISSVTKRALAVSELSSINVHLPFDLELAQNLQLVFDADQNPRPVMHARVNSWLTGQPRL